MVNGNPCKIHGNNTWTRVGNFLYNFVEITTTKTTSPQQRINFIHHCSLALPDRLFSFILGREKGSGEQPTPFLFYKSAVFVDH